MCELQFIKRINKPLTNNDKKQFITLLKKGAETNKDAFGIFTKEITFKTNNKVEDKIKNEILINIVNQTNTDWLVGHNRLTTQGKEDNNENNHPFETDNFKVVHNGIISNDKELKEEFKLDYPIETDSAIIPFLLEHKIKNNINNNTFMVLLKETIELLQGSYSVFLLDKRNGNLYYFKSSSTLFTFNLYEDNISKVIVGSTSKLNLDEIYLKKYGIFDIQDIKLLSSIDIDDGIIYKIDDNSIYPVCEFEQNQAYPKYEYNTNWERNYKKSNKLPRGYSETEYKSIEECISLVEDDIIADCGDININHDINWKEGFVVFKLNKLDEEFRRQLIRGLGMGDITKKGIKIFFDEMLETYSFFDVYEEYTKESLYNKNLNEREKLLNKYNDIVYSPKYDEQYRY